MAGTVVQLSVSGGGMPKLAVGEAKVTFEGLAGDWQLNRKHHGGARRAVCLYSLELYKWLADQGVALEPGQLGENITTRGVDLMEWKVGDRVRVGKAVIEITEPRVPCGNLDRWDERLMKMMEGRAGWLASVVVEGVVNAGDGMEVVGNDE